MLDTGGLAKGRAACSGTSVVAEFEKKRDSFIKYIDQIHAFGINVV